MPVKLKTGSRREGGMAYQTVSLGGGVERDTNLAELRADEKFSLAHRSDLSRTIEVDAELKRHSVE
jgi:hypothetical protein